MCPSSSNGQFVNKTARTGTCSCNSDNSLWLLESQYPAPISQQLHAMVWITSTLLATCKPRGEIIELLVINYCKFNAVSFKLAQSTQWGQLFWIIWRRWSWTCVSTSYPYPPSLWLRQSLINQRRWPKCYFPKQGLPCSLEKSTEVSGELQVFLMQWCQVLRCH